MIRDTIVALSSGALPAGIAVIRTSGPHARAAAEQVAGRLPEPRRAAVRRFIDPATGDLIDRGMLLWLPGPGTATGEDIAEYHCHGGRATTAAMIRVLAACDGVRLAEAGEFTRRALGNGVMDLTAAEGLADLLDAETELQRKIALRRSEGAVRWAVEDIRTQLVALSARAELAIDYDDEEDGAAMTLPWADLEVLATDIDRLLDRPPLERLRNGVRVVVAGPPNAGKSSLINRLAGVDRSIVTEIAGTTRDSIEVPMSVSGVPVILVDTAGLRESADRVERLGIQRANEELRGADLILWLGDEKDRPEGQVMVVANKSDLGGSTTGIPVSAKTGAGIDSLLSEIAAVASTVLPSPDQLALTARERDLLARAAGELRGSVSILPPEIVAEHLRRAREILGEITGHTSVDDMLDALFARFCVGK